MTQPILFLALVLVLALGGLLGGVLTWIRVGRRMEEARRAAEVAEAGLRTDLALARQVAESQASQGEVLRSELKETSHALRQAQERVAVLETTVQKEREALVLERRQLEEHRQVFRQEFENLAQ